MKELQYLGWSDFFGSELSEEELQSHSIGRVCTVNKTNYIVSKPDGNTVCELAGNLLYGLSPADQPKTGDWVAFLSFGEQGIITKVLKRRNELCRKKPGSKTERQVIATNVDYAIIVQCIEIGINLRRLERYMTQIKLAGITPLVIINKMDLLGEKPEQQVLIEEVKRKYKTILLSTVNEDGIDILRQEITEGKTYVLLGASGVGKSSITNALCGDEIQSISSISSASNKGAHTTTTRDLIVLRDSGILIDTPGTREFGLAQEGSFSAEDTSEKIFKLSQECRYQNCSHENEPGCAVIRALEDNEISQGEYENFLKMGRELEHYNANLKKRKEKGKQLSKTINYMKKFNKKNQ